MGGVDLEITRETDWRMKPGPLRKAAVAEFPRMDVDEDAHGLWSRRRSLTSLSNALSKMPAQRAGAVTYRGTYKPCGRRLQLLVALCAVIRTTVTSGSYTSSRPGAAGFGRYPYGKLATTRPRRAFSRLPRSVRDWIFSRSYSAITPWTLRRRRPSAVSSEEP